MVQHSFVPYDVIIKEITSSEDVLFYWHSGFQMIIRHVHSLHADKLSDYAILV